MFRKLIRITLQLFPGCKSDFLFEEKTDDVRSSSNGFEEWDIPSPLDKV